MPGRKNTFQKITNDETYATNMTLYLFVPCNVRHVYLAAVDDAN